MSNTWQDFLRTAGAVFSNDEVAHYDDTEAELAAAIDGDVIVDLSHYALLRITGADSATFMQGQFTNDVRQITATHSTLGSACSAKGRVMALFRQFRDTEDYYLRLPSALLSPTLERLRKYVLMSKVTLSDAGAELGRFGVSGPRVVAALAREAGGLPQHPDEVMHSNGLILVRVPGRHPRVEVYGAPEALTPLWQTLRQDARPAGADAWRLLDIRAGLPQVYPDTVEAYVPQMLNLQLVDGVSFRKGCYTGQEVVARMQYLGKLKRRMYLAHTDGTDRPQPGDELFCSSSESGQGAGKVVDACPAPGGGHDLLVVVERTLAENGAVVQLGDASGPALRFLPLPYAFPPEEEVAQTGG